jgi:hypothetical protein
VHETTNKTYAESVVLWRVVNLVHSLSKGSHTMEEVMPCGVNLPLLSTRLGDGVDAAPARRPGCNDTSRR